MTDVASQAQTRRIVVAIDDSVHARAALDAAAELAARLGAELVGVYVEDSDLFRIAELPFAAELSRLGGAPRAMSALALQRSLKLQADRLRRLVAQAAASHGLRWQFRAPRGRVAESLIAAAEESEMLVLGKASTSSVRHVHCGRIARAVVLRATRTVVVLQHGARITKPLLVLYDGTAAADRALAVGSQWAREDPDGLVVVVVLGDATRAAVEARARDVLAQAGGGVHARFVAPPSAGLAGLLAAAHAEGCLTLVLNADSRLAVGVDLAELAAAVDCPLAVTR